MIKNIVLIGNSLSTGGAEKVHAILSKEFCRQGYKVNNIIVNRFANEYKSSGKLINLDKKDNLFNLIYSVLRLIFLFIISKRKIIIDFRVRSSPRTELFLQKLFFRHTYYPTVHSNNVEMYLTNDSSFANEHYKNFTHVAVSEGVKARILNVVPKAEVIVIKNPIDNFEIDILKNEEFDIDFSYYLGVGRMEKGNVKQFDVMINAFYASGLHRNGIKLVLLGDGEMRSSFEQLAFDLGISESIIFRGFVHNPYVYYNHALCFLLTSKFEGFPNVILESLFCETPVISFDCPNGPSELIQTGYNGILVENQNIGKFSTAMNKLYFDSDYYQRCKNNARESVEIYKVDKIINQWINLFNE